MSEWQKRYRRMLYDRSHPRVLRVTLNRPERLNATADVLHREPVEVWRDIDADAYRFGMAGPWFHASLALEFMGFSGPEVKEGLTSHKEKRAPKFPESSPL